MYLENLPKRNILRRKEISKKFDCTQILIHLNCLYQGQVFYIFKLFEQYKVNV